MPEHSRICASRKYSQHRAIHQIRNHQFGVSIHCHPGPHRQQQNRASLPELSLPLHRRKTKFHRPGRGRFLDCGYALVVFAQAVPTSRRNLLGIDRNAGQIKADLSTNRPVRPAYRCLDPINGILKNVKSGQSTEILFIALNATIDEKRRFYANQRRDDAGRSNHRPKYLRS